MRETEVVLQICQLGLVELTLEAFRTWKYLPLGGEKGKVAEGNINLAIVIHVEAKDDLGK